MIIKLLKNFPHLAILFFILTVAFLPDIHKSTNGPESARWTWAHRIPIDYYGYLSYIRQGRTVFHQINQMTTEDTKPMYLHMYYTLSGRLGEMLDIRSDIVLFYGGILTFLLIYYFIASKILRLYFRGGIYWAGLFLVFLSNPLSGSIAIAKKEIIRTDDYSWIGGILHWGLDAYGRLTPKPHHLAGTVFALAVTYLLILFVKHRKIKYAYISALFTAIGTFLYFPPMLFLMLSSGLSIVIILILSVKNRRISLWNAGKSFTPFIPVFLSFLLVALVIKTVSDDSNIIVRFGQNISVTSWESSVFNYKNRSIGNLFLVYFLPYFGFLPLFFPGILYLRKNFRFDTLVFFMILFLPVALSFPVAKHLVPYPYIRLFFQTPYFAAAVISMFGLKYIREKWGKRIFVAVFAAYMIFQSAITFQGYRNNWLPWFGETFHGEGYAKEEYFPAFAYLNNNTKPYTNVMCMYNTCMLVVAFTHNKAYAAHDNATLEFPHKYYSSNGFFYCSLPEDPYGFLKKERIKYVFWDKSGLCDGYGEFLEEIFRSGNIYIFRVR